MARSKSNGSHYALTAIGVGLLVLGVVMAVWNLVPGFGSNDNPNPSQGNASTPENNMDTNLKSKTFSVAYVLVGSGIALLLLAICLSIRNRRKRRLSMEDAQVVQQGANRQPIDENDEEVDVPHYSAPSYEEVMRIGYGAPDTTETDQHEGMVVSLPSYESLTELDEATPTRPNAPAAKQEQPQRTNSRAAKEKKPLNIRRIKSDKLHLKEFRLNLSGQTKIAETQKIEPITPPPQYEDKHIGSEQPV
ncbi:transmembrane protein 51 [Hyla sarda]|uniref:transmembrane protein 51 n=1 Tax=Hyla sarda TaxID=327740 RepID=UPI0024C3755D|nr:transmembrane protein 51 [Hyla sarda]